MNGLKNASRLSGRLGYFWVFCGLMTLSLPAMATLEKEFVWESFGHQESLKIKLPAELKTHYSSKTRTFHYGNYVQEDAGYELNAKLAQAFQDRATEESLSEWQLINMVVDFVQSLEYQVEVGEYPKYPVETLVDGGGDCEDTSILLAAILDKLDVDCILLSPPGHMAVGVAIAQLKAQHYPYNGRNYYYVETTGTNWGIGAIPPTYAGSAKIYALPTKTAARHTVASGPAVDIEAADDKVVTNIMVAFYKAAIGEEEAQTKMPLYRYQVRVEADDATMEDIAEVQYRFLSKAGEVDPSIPWMRSYEMVNAFAKEWVAKDYRPMQVRIFFKDGNFAQTMVNFAPTKLSD